MRNLFDITCLAAALFPSIQLPFEQRTCFIKREGHLDKFLASFVIILRFHYTAKISFISPALDNKELFRQSSFYLINIISSVQLSFQQRYLHFSQVFFSWENPVGNVLDPN